MHGPGSVRIKEANFRRMGGVYPCEFECKTSAKTSELEVQECDSDTISFSTRPSRVTWSMMRLPCDYRSLDYIPPPDPFTPAEQGAAILKLISH